MIGPGKYDDLATQVQASTQARGVILIVIGGNRGEGFTVQATLDITLTLPVMLRNMADEIEADIATQGLT